MEPDDQGLDQRRGTTDDAGIISKPADHFSAEELGLRAKLFTKLREAYKGMSFNLAKAGSNDHFHYKYVRDLEAIEAVRAHMLEAGVVLIPHLNNVEWTTGGKIKALVTMRFEIADIETGYAIYISWVGEADAGDDKGINKALTAARKYFLIHLCLLVGDDGVEADADAGPVPEPARPKLKVETPKPKPTNDAEALKTWVCAIVPAPLRTALQAECKAAGLKFSEVSRAAQQEGVGNGEDFALFVRGTIGKEAAHAKEGTHVNG